MGAPSKRARNIRKASEFDRARLLAQLDAPNAGWRGFAWDLPAIYAARDEQMRGNFTRAAALAASTKTDAAIFPAFENRIAPQECVSVGLKAAPGARGKSICSEAEGTFGEEGVAITPDTQSEINAQIADHGVGFAQCRWTPREDGTRIDVVAKAWPIEHVWWDENARTFKTRTKDGEEETITHGDGRWLVFQKTENQPWLRGALCAIALVWARHAFGVRDQAKASVAHGNAKMIGEMPAGVALQDKDGNLTQEALAFVELLRSMLTGDAPVGIRPAGSTTEYVASASSAWQIFESIITNALKAAARIYLGTDGMLGAAGGAPGVDIKALFGVGQTIVQSDFWCLERGFNTLIEIWTAVNFGDSTLAPRRRFLVPDADEDARAESSAKREAAFFAHVRLARDTGFDVTQEYVEEIARTYRVSAPSLPVSSTTAPTITLAPTDIARVVTVNEARASAGIPALVLPDGSPDPDGRLTVEQFALKKAAELAPPAKPAPTPAAA